MQIERITSRQNYKIKHTAHLKNKKHRIAEKLFLIEGLREIQIALNNHIQLETVFFSKDLFSSKNHPLLLDKLLSICNAACEIPSTLFKYLSHREGSDGLLVTANTWESSLTGIQLSNKPFLLIAENIEKPGNIGSLIRSSSAVGVDALILTDTAVDIFNPNVIRASQGQVFSVPIVNASNEETLTYLRAQNINIAATTPSANKLHWETCFDKISAILMGSEKDGLTNFWLNNADEKIKLPLIGQADSLNVGTAAAAVLYEALRQRSQENP